MAPADFKGPWSPDLIGFAKSIASMPANFKSSFDETCDISAKTITNQSHLHIWESDSDIDSLLQLTQVIMKVRSLSNYVPGAPGAGKMVPAGMIIIAQISPEHDHFRRICQLVKHLTKDDGRAHLNKTIYSFGHIAVVKGIDNLKTPNKQGEYDQETKALIDKAVKRVNICIERTFKLCAYVEKKIVWHHGAIIHFLNHWIYRTSSTLRKSLAAITLTSTISVAAKAISSTTLGKMNQAEDFKRLEDYCKRLKIFAVFLDPASQLIEKEALSVYTAYFGYYAHMYFTPSLLRPHLHLGYDALVTFAFRLRSACESKYADHAVKTVQKHLPAKRAKAWANVCTKPATFTKDLCRAQANDKAISAATHVADTPLLPFKPGPPSSFARLTMGPAASLLSGHYICAPVAFNFQNSPMQMRAASPSPFHIWLPKPGHDEAKITQRIQGIMMGVLDMVLKEKGMPVIDPKSEDAETWSAVIKAVAWALDGTKGKLPKGYDHKIESVRKALAQSWSYNYWGPQI
ncbi:hypothetical protein BU24DRAFT_480311 [Aaosphaeria arxii CBS 175.79]|uniref:Uncharacterized protein n=1 Tax=Aaosphaeria arxii CBS 175.79 TaxID=1450172 RepID=A0A6A5XRU2_9PLEO|nr:uncharacterized protein BU24DRAFT_480311 [Aaosphaeria arxii CBS 175.79]KAF2015557.1 hypothetical protein BU24DRAFT_480311 [Aaosphaeria arxii CBS 175.79]